jgi:hypothetical protein
MSISDLFFPNDYNLWINNLVVSGSLTASGTLNVPAVSTCGSLTGNVQTAHLDSCGSGAGQLTITGNMGVIITGATEIKTTLIQDALLGQLALLGGDLAIATYGNIYFNGFIIIGANSTFDTATNIFAQLTLLGITPTVGQTFQMTIKNQSAASAFSVGSSSDNSVQPVSPSTTPAGPAAGIVIPASTVTDSVGYTIRFQIVDINSVATPAILAY